MINGKGEYVAYSGGKSYVVVRDGEKAYQMPIDTATQQFTHHFGGTWFHEYVLGIVDRRYRRRGLDDRTYFLNVLTARANPMIQGWFLGLKSIFLLPIVMSPKYLFKGSYWGMDEVIIFIALVMGFLWLNRARTKAMENDQSNWDMEIYHNGLQSCINKIQG